jgi:agmatinase
MHGDRFLGCSLRKIAPRTVALLGCPLDLTSTYRAGSAEAPRAIRISSDSIETYSPLLDRDLIDYCLCDLGDIPLSHETLEEALEKIQASVTEIVRQGGTPLCLGGEHTITLPIVKALERSYPDLMILHLDAHADLRTSYEGSTLNHATVMRHVAEIVGPERLIQMGIRSGTREEFDWMRDHGTLMQWGPGDETTLLERVSDVPVYVSMDLDVLDPACLPGTGNPEAGGWFYSDLERLFHAMESMTLIGGDVVELNPGLDSSEISTIAAAKIVRELLLVFSQHR